MSSEPDYSLPPAEVRLRFYGGCSICKIPAAKTPSFWMCSHAAALTQAQINSLRRRLRRGED